ncbi:hypothetical protein [Ruegeria arenilitoris]|uniref:hypothetical protein n=1 Tax=Ruegeria arenilitoris TaxID=1173585 RepID=UPI001C2BC5BF|nr:hypothetical protein [Ruegeria arenilitoris]
MKGMITAVEMSQSEGIDPKDFRSALRAANFKWHSHNDRWVVPIGSSQHEDMLRVLSELTKNTSQHASTVSAGSVRPSARQASNSDEAWIIDLCDKALGKKAMRQHRFPFLLGDPGSSGRRVPLPVDAYYPDLALVIEYHERQHTSSVTVFDKRKTVSGVGRREQRRLYDKRRQEVLPENGYELIVFDYSEFKHDRSGRLIRDPDAETIVANRLSGF